GAPDCDAALARFRAEDCVLAAERYDCEHVFQTSDVAVHGLREVQEIILLEVRESRPPGQLAGFAARQQNRIGINGSAAHEHPCHGIQRIVLNHAEDPPWPEHPSDLARESGTRSGRDVMIYAHGGYEIEFVISERNS